MEFIPYRQKNGSTSPDLIAFSKNVLYFSGDLHTGPLTDLYSSSSRGRSISAEISYRGHEVTSPGYKYIDTK